MELETLLRAVEARHHFLGWDTHPRTLYAVLRQPWNHDEVAVRSWLLTTMSAPPAAHLLVMEGWWREFSNQAEHDAEDRLYADIPGSLECRLAIGVTYDETIRLLRIRDRQPELLASDSSLGSGMVASLRIVHQATINLFPTVHSGL